MTDLTEAIDAAALAMYGTPRLAERNRDMAERAINAAEATIRADERAKVAEEIAKAIEAVRDVPDATQWEGTPVIEETLAQAAAIARQYA